jgi:hypothetical protein
VSDRIDLANGHQENDKWLIINDKSQMAYISISAMKIGYPPLHLNLAPGERRIFMTHVMKEENIKEIYIYQLKYKYKQERSI